MEVCYESSLLKDGYTRVSNSHLRELLNAKEEYENLRKSYEKLEEQLKRCKGKINNLTESGSNLAEMVNQLIIENLELTEENTKLIEENEKLKKENELALHIEEEIPFSDYADQEYIDFLESEEGLAYIKAMDSQYGYLN